VHTATAGATASVRLVILPDNGRPVMTDEQMQAEREEIARQSLVPFETIEGDAVDMTDADAVTDTFRPKSQGS
jgi:hypothetical protein